MPIQLRLQLLRAEGLPRSTFGVHAPYVRLSVGNQWYCSPPGNHPVNPIYPPTACGVFNVADWQVDAPLLIQVKDKMLLGATVVAARTVSLRNVLNPALLPMAVLFEPSSGRPAGIVHFNIAVLPSVPVLLPPLLPYVPLIHFPPWQFPDANALAPPIVSSPYSYEPYVEPYPDYAPTVAVQHDPDLPTQQWRLPPPTPPSSARRAQPSSARPSADAQAPRSYPELRRAPPAAGPVARHQADAEYKEGEDDDNGASEDLAAFLALMLLTGGLRAEPSTPPPARQDNFDPDSMPYERLLEWERARGAVRAPAALTREQLAALPSYRWSGGGQQQDASCSVCLTEYEQNERLRRLPCFHVFHQECIDDW